MLKAAVGSASVQAAGTLSLPVRCWSKCPIPARKAVYREPGIVEVVPKFGLAAWVAHLRADRPPLSTHGSEQFQKTRSFYNSMVYPSHFPLNFRDMEHPTTNS